jgi:hypothetical protein
MPSRERDGDTSTESPLQENASLDVTLSGQPAALSPSPAPPPTVVSNTTPHH